MQENVKQLLRGIIHPETQQNIVDSGIVEQINAREDKITIVLCFPKSRDPFAIRIKSLVEQSLEQAFPEAAEDITVVIKEGTPRAPQPKRESTTIKVGKIIAIASGKGGVGKSTVTANLAKLPAIATPCGYDENKIPIGISFTGKPFDEKTIIAVCDRFEKEAQKWQATNP